MSDRNDWPGRWAVFAWDYYYPQAIGEQMKARLGSREEAEEFAKTRCHDYNKTAVLDLLLLAGEAWEDDCCLTKEEELERHNRLMAKRKFSDARADSTVGNVRDDSCD